MSGLRCEGIELVPFLVRAARATADRAGVCSCSFVCADMLGYDVSAAQLLLLTSQCWDPVLCARLRAKLLAELPEGALVVDYTAAMGDDGGEARCGAPPTCRAFVLLEKVLAPVSWDASHVFWVWRCESLPTHSSTSHTHRHDDAQI